MKTTLLSLAAAAALGVAALAPTAASAAYWHRGHHHPHFGRVFFAPTFHAPAYAYGACVYRQRVVPTPWGPRLRLVPVCY